MAVAKQFLKSKPLAKVTFELSAEAVNGAKTVALAGEFNGWDAQALKKQKDGSYKTTIESRWWRIPVPLRFGWYNMDK